MLLLLHAPSDAPRSPPTHTRTHDAAASRRAAFPPAAAAAPAFELPPPLSASRIAALSLSSDVSNQSLRPPRLSVCGVEDWNGSENATNHGHLRPNNPQYPHESNRVVLHTSALRWCDGGIVICIRVPLFSLLLLLIADGCLGRARARAVIGMPWMRPNANHAQTPMLHRPNSTLTGGRRPFASTFRVLQYHALFGSSATPLNARRRSSKAARSESPRP